MRGDFKGHESTPRRQGTAGQNDETPRGRGFGVIIYSQRVLLGYHVCRLRAFGTILDIKAHALSLRQGLETVALNGTKMNEDVAFAVILGDEAIALTVVEPLHFACCHCAYLSKLNQSDCRSSQTEQSGHIPKTSKKHRYALQLFEMYDTFLRAATNSGQIFVGSGVPASKLWYTNFIVCLTSR